MIAFRQLFGARLPEGHGRMMMGIAANLIRKLPEPLPAKGQFSAKAPSKSGTKRILFFKNEPEKLLKTNGYVSK
jgi:hypothetical protein